MHEWLHRIDQHFPVRYTAWIASAVGLLLRLSINLVHMVLWALVVALLWLRGQRA